MNEEIWKPIIEFEDRYEISSKGRVKSLARARQFGSNVRLVNERVLKPATYRNGYLFVVLSNYPIQQKQIMLHRLVAIHFIENPDNKAEVNHKDGVKSNNTIENLEWVTHQENAQHKQEFLINYPDKNCAECDKSFAPQTKGQTYCSNSCRGNFRRKAKVDDEIRRCEACNAEFSAWKYGKKRFCSKECKPAPNPFGSKGKKGYYKSSAVK